MAVRRAKKRPAAASYVPRTLAPSGLIYAPDSGGEYTHHKFVSTTSVYTDTGNVVDPQLKGVLITFNSLSNYGLYTSLFDAYRIDVVEVIFNLQTNPSSGGKLPRLTVYPDYDDASAPASLANALSHPRAMQHVFSEARPTFKFKFVPMLASPVAGGGVFTSYSTPNRPVFVDSQSAGASHYGYKYAFENFTDTSQSINVTWRVWFTCRNPV
jgi:hypothetical protein